MTEADARKLRVGDVIMSGPELRLPPYYYMVIAPRYVEPCEGIAMIHIASLLTGHQGYSSFHLDSLRLIEDEIELALIALGSNG